MWTSVLLKGEEQEGGDRQGGGDESWDSRKRRKESGHLSGPSLLACNTQIVTHCSSICKEYVVLSVLNLEVGSKPREGVRLAHVCVAQGG